MKRLLTGAVLGALALGAIPISASADPLDPVVEGTAAFQVVGVPNSNATRIAWACEAHADGPAIGTAVTCILKLDGEEIDRTARALLGPAAVAGDVTEARYGTVEVCWEALALLPNGELLTDTGCTPA